MALDYSNFAWGGVDLFVPAKPRVRFATTISAGDGTSWFQGRDGWLWWYTEGAWWKASHSFAHWRQMMETAKGWAKVDHYHTGAVKQIWWQYEDGV